SESSLAVRSRVAVARQRAEERGVRVNRHLRGAALEAWAPLHPAATAMLRDQLASGALTMRGAERVRAVALTLSDLAGEELPISPELLRLALALRSGDVGTAASR
ncbi:MAG: ATP-binding protein, partial [Actinomycetes bacterium]